MSMWASACRGLTRRATTVASANMRSRRFHTPTNAAATFGSTESVSGPFKPILVSIEGNIGAGKTTLLKKLRKKHPEWTCIDEPVDTWSHMKDDEGQTLLQLFYKDQHRWSYTFQNCALLTRYQIIEDTVRAVGESIKTGPHVFLTERCLETDKHVFTKMLRADGSINKLENDLYERWFRQLSKSATPLAGIVYADTKPEECLLRIHKRNRKGEESISKEYLASLDEYQGKWLSKTATPLLTSSVSDVERVEAFIEGLVERAKGK